MWPSLKKPWTGAHPYWLLLARIEGHRLAKWFCLPHKRHFFPNALQFLLYVQFPPQPWHCILWFEGEFRKELINILKYILGLIYVLYSDHLVGLKIFVYQLYSAQTMTYILWKPLIIDICFAPISERNMSGRNIHSAKQIWCETHRIRRD